MAATLIFLKIHFDNKPVTGESSAVDYEQQIEVEAMTWGMNADPTKKNKGNATERPDVRLDEVRLSKHFDRASTSLCNYMSSRKKFSTARLTFTSAVMREGKQRPRPIMELVLTDGMVEQVRLSAAESGNAITVREDVSLSFTKLRMVYYPPTAERNVRAAPATFDVQAPGPSNR